VVRAQARQDGTEWQIEVVDDGIGIEPEYADKAGPGTTIRITLPSRRRKHDHD
jgi:hypothetical protein